MPHDPAQERKLIEEETKLTASWINGFSLGFMALGVIQPIVATTFSAWSMLLLVAGAVLHLLARFWLRRWFPLE